MNFLAHIYLSSDNELLTIGNFAADGVRGSNYKHFPIAMQAGIKLHREIDTFTDAHFIVKQSTKRLHKNYGHYSGVIVDIFYDHFLAKNWASYSEENLKDYTKNFYQLMQTHFEILPERIQLMLPFMMTDNWLLSYASLDGIQRVFNGMNKRIEHISNMNEATNELKIFYDEFEEEFTLFFKELIDYTEQKRIEITKRLNS